MSATTVLRFECPAYYDLYMTCHAHGWKNLAPFSWDDRTHTLRFAALVDDSAVDIVCRQKRQAVSCLIASHRKLTTAQRDTVRKMICRSLSLNCDTRPLLEKAEKIDPEYAPLVRKGAGRLLRSPTIWEDAAKTLFTTNCTWALTRKMCGALCTKGFVPETPSGIYPFPLPQFLAAHRPEQIKIQAPVGYRARYLKALAERFALDPELNRLESNGYDYGAADRIVRALQGFADYGCAHLLVMAGYFDKIPVDTTVVSFLKNTYRVRKPDSFIARRYGKWGTYKWWGYKLDRIIRNNNWIGQ